MPKRYNTRLIKASRSYSPSEIAKLFDIDRKTCFRWIKSKGLRVIEKNTNPLLVYGKDLKEFIIKIYKKKTNENNRKLILFFKIWFQLREQIEILYAKKSIGIKKSTIPFYLNFDLLENLKVEFYDEKTESIKLNCLNNIFF
jgi:hypothetical protein